MSAVLALAAAALACWPGRRLLPAGVRSAPAMPKPQQRLDAMMPALLATAVLALVLTWRPDASGAVLAPSAAGATFYLLRRMRAGTGRHQPDEALPLTLTVAALLLRSGAPPGAALSEAASGCASTNRQLCAQVDRRLSMGEPAGRAWSLLYAHPELAAVARAAVRTSDSGAALAQAWESVGRRQRADRRLAAEIRARKVGVRALAPLGLCFLPAFVCLGVVPMVIGLAADIL